jgi:hypothetical protein
MGHPNRYRGIPRTEEVKRKISEAKKGKSFSGQGLANIREAAKRRGPRSEATKEKMRARRHTEDQKKRIGDSLRGRKRSPEATLKQIETRKLRYPNGSPNQTRFWAGKTRRQETCQKIKEDNLRNPRRYWLGKTMSAELRLVLSKAHLGQSPANKGTKASPEIRAKLRVAHLGKKLPPALEAKRVASLARGERHWRWKGGITSENIKERNSQQAKAWSKDVLARDGFTCLKCGIRGKRLQAHHVVNWAEHPELRYVTDNDATLCKPDHDSFHSIYGRKQNSRNQLEEFLNAARSIQAA